MNENNNLNNQNNVMNNNQNNVMYNNQNTVMNNNQGNVVNNNQNNVMNNNQNTVINNNQNNLENNNVATNNNYNNEIKKPGAFEQLIIKTNFEIFTILSLGFVWVCNNIGVKSMFVYYIFFAVMLWISYMQYKYTRRLKALYTAIFIILIIIIVNTDVLTKINSI